MPAAITGMFTGKSNQTSLEFVEIASITADFNVAQLNANWQFTYISCLKTSQPDTNQTALTANSGH